MAKAPSSQASFPIARFNNPRHIAVCPTPDINVPKSNFFAAWYDHAGRLQVWRLNSQFLEADTGVAEYGSAMRAAIAQDFLTMHPSGGHVTFTQEDADLFA